MPDPDEHKTVFGGVHPFPPGETAKRPERPEVLFGQIAVTEGMIRPEQLAEALEAQESGAEPVPLGEVLIDKGHLEPKALRRILEIQARRLSEQDPATLETLEEALFGKKVLHLGLATEREVNEALREQGRRKEEGEAIRLGQILVEAGALTPSQARRILQRQQKEVLFCPACFVQYNIVGFEPGRTFRCKSCKGELRVPEANEDAPVDPETQVLGDGSARLRSVDELTVADRSSRPSYSNVGELDGDTFGDYRILRKVARGGMGVVYQAVQMKLNRIVALKILLGGDMSTDEELHRFQLEAKAAAQLNHPYIVPIYDVGEIEGRHYFTMDFIKGRTLSRIIRKGGLPTREALIITKKVADGLHYAHQKGIVHRDIKPANVIVDNLGNPRLTDFGIVKDLFSDTGVTKTGEVMGTPAYMSPEQAMGEEKIDGRADVYSLGAVLYELITSKPPFTGENSMEVLMKCLKEDPIPPKQLNKSIHKDVETICLKSLEKDPEKRYASAEAMKQDIDRYLNGETIQARPVGWAERQWRKVLRHKAVSVTAVAGLFAVLAVTTVAVAAKQRSDRQARVAISDHIRKGHDCLKAENFQGALFEFNKALTYDEDHPDAIRGRNDAEKLRREVHDRFIQEGNRLLEEGDYEPAILKFQEAMKILARSDQALDGLDRAQADKAEDEKTRKIRGESAALLQQGQDLAQRARSEKDREEAIRLFEDAVIRMRTAVAKDRDYEEATNALYLLLLEYGKYRYEGEEPAFDVATNLFNEAEGYGDGAEELELLRADLDRTKADFLGYTRALKEGRDRLDAGDPDSAIVKIQRALAIHRTAEAREALRQARYQKGMADGRRLSEKRNWKEALAAYGSALLSATEDDRPEVEARLEATRESLCDSLIEEARLARDRGDREEALRLYQEVLRHDEDHPIAKVMLADMQRTKETPEGKVYVPSGDYALGSDPSVRSFVRPVYVDRYEVTNRQYKEFIDAGGYRNEKLWDPEGWSHIGELVSRDDGLPGPLLWKGGSYSEAEADHPVTGVCWYEARAYARWKGERLPKELEWEKAASLDGNDRREYPWGNEFDPSLGGPIRAVGENKTDESALGVRDLGANATEWVEEDRTGEALLKGSSSLIYLERYARCSYRVRQDPLWRWDGTGFRCVREIVEGGGS